MRRRWTKEEDEILFKLFKNTNTIRLSLILNRPPKKVGKRAWDLGLRKDKEFVIEQIRENSTKNRKCKICENKHFAHGFCRKHEAHYQKGHLDKNGLVLKDFKECSLWNDEEIYLLKVNYPNKTFKELKEIFPQKSNFSIRSKAGKLKLCKNKETFIRCNKEKMTEESKIKTSCSLQGINRSDFKQFLTNINIRLRATNEYSNWRNNIYKRDCYTCQKCKKLGKGDLHAHHIIHLSKLIKQYPKELNDACMNDQYFYDIKNGITVCENCHSKIHNNSGLAIINHN